VRECSVFQRDGGRGRDARRDGLLRGHPGGLQGTALLSALLAHQVLRAGE
jgi:hypothetical protein